MEETDSNTPLRTLRPEERRERNESPYSEAHTRNERTVTRTLAGGGDGTTSVLPFANPSTTYPPPSATTSSATYPPPSAKPSAPSPPPLKRPSASTPLLSSPPASGISSHSILRPSASTSLSSSPPAPPGSAKTVYSQINTPRGALSSDPQALSRRATFDPPPSTDRRWARPRADEAGLMDPSAASHRDTTSHRPAANLEYTPATTDSPQQGHKGAFAAPDIAPIHPEYIPSATERPSLQDHKGSTHMPALVPNARYIPDVTQYQKVHTEGSIQRTDSSYRGYDSSASHLPDTRNSRKKIGHSSYTAPPSEETSMNKTNSTTSSANLWPQPPSDSQTHLTSDKSSIFPANLD